MHMVWTITAALKNGNWRDGRPLIMCGLEVYVCHHLMHIVGILRMQGEQLDRLGFFSLGTVLSSEQKVSQCFESMSTLQGSVLVQKQPFLIGAAREGPQSVIASASHLCQKLTNCEQGNEDLEMPLSAHLASLSHLVLISDNCFGFCEAPLLAMGSAHNKLNPGHGGGEVCTRWVEGIDFFFFFSPFQSYKALRVISCVCDHVCFLCFHWK